MRKLIFILALAISGSFGIASAQVEQSGSQVTSPGTQSTTQTKSKTQQGTTQSTQGTYQSDTTKREGNLSNTEGTHQSTTTKKKSHSNATGTSTNTQGTSGTYQESGTSTGSSGTGSSTKSQGTYQGSGTGSTGTGTSTGSQGTYQGTGTGSTGTGTGTESGTMNKKQGTSTGSQGTYQGTGTGSTGTGTGTKAGSMNQNRSDNEKGWTKIGEKTVDLSKNSDEISVTGSETFSSIKIKVSDAAMVDLGDLEVEFEGGSKQNIDLETPINSSTGESEVIELNSSEGKVKKISFDYKTRATWKDSDETSEVKDAKEKTKVEIWGLKSDTAQR